MTIRILRTSRSLLSLSLILILMHATKPHAAARQEQVDFSQLDKVVIEELKERNTPGAAVAIIQGDRVVYAKGYGVASVETGAPVTPDMLFRLGSTTKMFTAAALVTLAAREKVKLDEPIGGYVKGLSPRLAQATAHHLLSNTSGMKDFAAPFISNDDEALGRSVRTWKDDVFFTEPGKINSYSSPGFWLSGLVIEEVGGKPYADMMDELIFKPVGMQRTTLRPLAAMTHPMALGHSVEGNSKPTVMRPLFNNTTMWPAGSIFSSVNDLSCFVIAMMNGGRVEGKQVLDPLVVSKLPAPHVLLPGETDAHYGYGLLRFNQRGVRVVMHGGFSRGYGSMIQMAPEHRFAVIVVTNRSGETLNKTRTKALEMALPLKAEESRPTTALTMSRAELANYAGVYSHEPQLWEVIVKDDKLILKQDGVETALTKIGEHKFSLGASGGELVFVPGDDGKIKYLFDGLYAAIRK
ncbi:MAG TPA: serine hydrolase domain-containing protein [Blastocatellia bacterium]|nr:serine hydrolase domain-containing protein [Blastocatellia bacterium]